MTNMYLGVVIGPVEEGAEVRVHDCHLTRDLCIDVSRDGWRCEGGQGGRRPTREHWYARPLEAGGATRVVIGSVVRGVVAAAGADVVAVVFAVARVRVDAAVAASRVRRTG